ncbi:hypothetical protein D3C78_899110 [compost metagenome]
MPVYLRTITTRASANHSVTDQVTVWTTVHNALIALGLTQTEDTGQYASFVGSVVNTAPIERGYRVYKMTDSLGDLYIRVGFWSGFNCMAAISMDIGYATDGAGVIVDGVGASAGNTTYGFTYASSSSYFYPTGTFCAVRGDGFLFVSLADGGMNCYPGGDASSRFSHAGLGTRGSFGWAAVGRQTDEAGALLSDKLVAVGGGVPVGISTTTSNLGMQYTSTPPQSYLTAKQAGQGVRQTITPAALVCMETARTRSGNPAVGRVYADYPDTGPLPIRWLGAMPTENATPQDTVELALVGATAKKYRHACASGYPAFAQFSNTSGLGTGRYLAPMVEDDGVMV